MRAIRREVELATRFPAIAGLIVALLVAIVSAVGISSPATYANETVSWRVQGIGQDWIDLVVAVPWLAIAAIATLRATRGASLLLGGALAYMAYSFAIYAFAVHFNQLFVVYCAILGLSCYGLGALVIASRDARPWPGTRVPRRSSSILLIASALAFALMWLAVDVPAVIRNEPPPGLADVGLPSNPIHVLDLALVLPAMFASGVMLWRKRRTGYVLAAIAMGFCVLMDVNIAGIVVAMHHIHLPADLGVAFALGGIGSVTAVLLVLLLRAEHPYHH